MSTTVECTLGSVTVLGFDCSIIDTTLIECTSAGVSAVAARSDIIRSRPTPRFVRPIAEERTAIVKKYYHFV